MSHEGFEGPQRFDAGVEERLRMALREDVPAPMDAQSIMVGARRRRTRQRMQVAGALASAAVVLGGVPLVATMLQGQPGANSASAPRGDAKSRGPAQTRSATATTRAGAPPAPTSEVDRTTSIVLVDGLRVEPRRAGFCVVRGRTGQSTCRDTEGALGVAGDTRRWVVFHGAHRSDSVQYAAGGDWLRMEPRIAFHGAPTMVAYAADPAGDGPFRVRQLGPDEKVIWEG